MKTLLALRIGELQCFMDNTFLYTDECILIPSLSAEVLGEVEEAHQRISGGSSVEADHGEGDVL